MDLKDVIAKVNKQAMEAHNAFHAGHHDVAELHLGRIWWLIEDGLPGHGTKKSDVTESATSEKMDAELKELPHPAVGPEAQPAAGDPAAAAQQKALDQAGP